MSQLSKCKFCGTPHRLGQCPELQTKSPRDVVERPEKRPVGVTASKSKRKHAGEEPGKPNGREPGARGTKSKGKTKKKAKKARRQAVKALPFDGSTAGSNPAAPAKLRRGPPRKGEEHATLTARKPWIKLGISRSQFYKRQKALQASEAK